MKTERAKMLAGELYLASDPDLAAERVRARRLLATYNTSCPDEPKVREELLGELLGRAGIGASIEPPFYCDYGGNILLGDFVYMNFGCVILDCAEVSIGRSVFLGPYVQLLTAKHPLEPKARSSGPELASPITIGDDVWLGGGVIVSPGVSIGAGTTIGAGSVVTRDIPPGVLAFGNPCRVIRNIDETETH